jgi:methionyl-tRNA synthetase
MGSFYITTAINYVNAIPHLGHAYEVVGADVIARHRRQAGDDVFFLTGTDEHGEPVALAAAEQKTTPQEMADRNVEHFKSLLPRLEISNDFFIRTTDKGHADVVQDVLTRVKDNGHVYLGEYEGWYCPRCADFKADTELGPGDTCLIHGIVLLRQQEDNYFFALSKFQKPLEELFADRADWLLPKERRNEILAFIGGGLRDVSLTRSKMSWGVQVPWDDGHVFYVWFEALLNYYSALAYARDGEDLTDRYWPCDVHLIGKDITKFHAVFWPALLMAAEIELPKKIFAHGFLLGADGRKMSKSDGNVLDPVDVLDEFGADALRFYLLRDVNFGSDGATSIAAVKSRYESELANDLGNLASRAIAMIGRYRDGVVPQAALDEKLSADFDDLVDRVGERMAVYDLTAALEEIWVLVRRLNRYVEERAPWQLAKDEANSNELDTVLASLAEGIRVVAVLLHPFIPGSIDKLLGALNSPDVALASATFGAAVPGRVESLDPLFPKQR